MTLHRDCLRQRRKHSVFLCLFYVYCCSVKQNLPVVLAEISPVFNESIPLVALSGIFTNEIVESLDHHETVELPFQYEADGATSAFVEQLVDDRPSKTVLVLGSAGVIGKGLVSSLEAAGHTVLEVKNRRHIDLRIAGSLDQFDDTPISFVFFLACEVGGSKFLDTNDSSVQQSIIENNLKIYQTVFPYLERRRIPFIFTSSYLQAQPTVYGAIKRLGERWVELLKFGRSVRLWNVYGFESIGVRSHVIADWISSCITQGVVHAQTDGREARQFLHVSDCASALTGLMSTSPHQFARLPAVVDLSSGVWTTMRELAILIEEAVAPKECVFEFSERKAVARARLAPRLELNFHKEWFARVDIESGIRFFVEQFKQHGVHYDARVSHDLQHTTPQIISPDSGAPPTERQEL